MAFLPLRAPYPDLPKSLVISRLLVITGLALLGLVFFQIIGLGLLYLIYGTDLSTLKQLMERPQAFPSARQQLLFLQAFTAFGTFVLMPVIYLMIYEPRSLGLLFGRRFRWQLLGLGLLAWMAAAPLITWMVQVNDKIDFDRIFPGFEAWARGSEDRLNALTQLLVKANGPLDLAWVIVVVAVIPGLGEELLFRGLVQPKLHRAFGNAHVAIWVTAFIFSAIHMQFYGLIPRMLLGALFGYVFYYGGNLLLPICLHITNNLVTLLAYQANAINTEGVPTGLEAWAGWLALPATALVVALLAFYAKIAAQGQSHHPA